MLPGMEQSLHQAPNCPKLPLWGHLFLTPAAAQPAPRSRKMDNPRDSSSPFPRSLEASLGFFWKPTNPSAFSNPTRRNTTGAKPNASIHREHRQRREKPDFLEEIPPLSQPRFASFWAGGQHGCPVFLRNSRRESRQPPGGTHYTHDYPLDAGNRGLAACGTPVIQVMDLQHSLLKYQTQQFFTAFTLEFMAQGGDLRTRRRIIALFSS